MKGFPFLLGRELRRRALLVGTGAALGVFVALAPWLPGFGRHDPADLRSASALGIGMLWALAVATFEGSGFLARDLGERRLAFDFRLPAGATAIWAARLLGALGAAAASVGLVLAPGVLFGAELGGAGEGARQWLSSLLLVTLPPLALVAPLLLVLVFLVAHAAALARATRSPWLAADWLCALAFTALGLSALAPLDLWGAREELGRQLIALIGIATAALLAATAAQAIRGRSEPDRAHRPFTLTLAALSLLPVLAVSARTEQYLSPEPADLDAARHEPEMVRNQSLPRQTHFARRLSADWEERYGWAAGRETISFHFLSDSKTGRWIRRGPVTGLPRLARPAAVSADGSTLAWLEAGLRRGDYGEARLLWVDLTESEQVAPRVALAWPHTPLAWALSPDGRRVASYWPQESSSSDVRQLRIEGRDGRGALLAVRIPGCQAAAPLEYPSASTVRVRCRAKVESAEDPPVREARDVDVATGVVTTVAAELDRSNAVER